MSGEARRYVVLDSWRGIAALMVCLFHFAGNNHLADLPIVTNGYLFVDFFFVLSGFVITHAYADTLVKSATLPSFIAIRFARLYPVHVFMLALFIAYEFLQILVIHLGGSVATPPFSEAARSPVAILTNLLFIHGLGVHDTVTWNGPSWSISTEFFTYILFGTSCFLASGLRIATYILTIFLSLFILMKFSTDFMDATYDLGIFRNLYGFAIGALVYYLLQSAKENPLFGALSNTWSEIGALVLIVAFISIAGDRWISFFSPIIFAISLVVFSAENGQVSRFLRSSSFVFLGKISFSLYMCHRFLHMVVFPSGVRIVETVTGIPFAKKEMTANGQQILIGADPFQGDVALVLTLAVTIVTAWLLHTKIEMPVYKWAKRKIQSRDSIQ